MNGDLSLSRALGGLRIANPDDSEPNPSRETPPDAAEAATPAQPTRHPSQDDTIGTYSPAAAHLPPFGTGATNTPSPGLAVGDPSRAAQETATAMFNPAQGNFISTPNRTPVGVLDSNNPQSYSPERINVARSPRPTSGLYAAAGSSKDPGPYNALRTEPSRSSMYGIPSRGDSSAAPMFGGPIPSREPSQRERPYNANRPPQLPPGAGAFPPRRSSKGMGGGYAGPAAPPGPQPSNLSEGPGNNSSEEWKDKGAAVSTRREIDANGRPVVRSVKKGVRDFSFGRILGEGSYSTVFLATDRQTLREYAIKVLEKKHIIREKKIKYVNIEKNTLNRLVDHPGIVRLYYTFQDESSLYYVLDLCNGGELLGVLKKTGTFDEECTRFYGAQVLDAIEYMHSRGVIHRDLKPENVLLDDQMHVKITDFGTAKLLRDPRDPLEPSTSNTPIGTEEDNRAASFVGTAEYVSPELLSSRNASKASDIWAFGCIIYQLLAGRPPFKAATEYLTFQKIVNLEYEFPAGFPPAAQDLVERCLVIDPGRRLTIEHIKNHEFFEGQPFGKGLWKSKAPRLKPYVPPAQEPHIIQLNGGSSTPKPIGTSRGPPANPNRPPRLITELPPPTQLDIEWSPVLTRTNERILKLGDLMVTSTPLPNSPHGKDGEGHKKLARFFGGSTTKKRQRLVMVTSSGRIVLAPAGGEEKKAKQEISLLGTDCAWRSQIDAKGQAVWCVDTNGIHYTFEEPKGSVSSDMGSITVDDWLEALERAKDFAVSLNLGNSYSSDNGFGDYPSSVSSAASTMDRRINYNDCQDGFSVSDRSHRNQLSKAPGNKSQASLEDTVKRNRFSKRQSKNGLGAAF